MRQDDFYLDDRPSKVKYILLIAVTVLLLIAIFAGAYFLVFGREEQDAYESMQNSEETFLSSQLESAQTETHTSEVQHVVQEILLPEEEPHILIAEGVRENNETTNGIDVSRYQGNIDWSKVAADDIDFAMIRVGYRTMESGEIVEDSSAKYNMQEQLRMV